MKQIHIILVGPEVKGDIDMNTEGDLFEP